MLGLGARGLPASLYVSKKNPNIAPKNARHVTNLRRVFASAPISDLVGSSPMALGDPERWRCATPETTAVTRTHLVPPIDDLREKDDVTLGERANQPLPNGVDIVSIAILISANVPLFVQYSIIYFSRFKRYFSNISPD